MRWAALGVDYEMSGKDLIDSVQAVEPDLPHPRRPPPVTLTYELFLDEEGRKISKSKGNGLAVEDWLKYGTNESLRLFMYQRPQSAKRLYVDVIPRSIDDYQDQLGGVLAAGARRSASTIRSGTSTTAGRRASRQALSFDVLLNLASVVQRRGSRTCSGSSSRATARGDAGERAAARPADRPRRRVLSTTSPGWSSSIARRAPTSRRRSPILRRR